MKSPEIDAMSGAGGARSGATGEAELYDHDRKTFGVRFSERWWKHTDGEVPF